MNNKYRLKIIYKDIQVTLDIAENTTFDELSSIINEKLSLADTKAYKYLRDDAVIISNRTDKSKTLKEVLELDQKLIYVVGTGMKVHSINIIVWDYVGETDERIIKKFNQMVKKLNQEHHDQVYYLNNGQRKFIDTLLSDCYDTLKSLRFSGIYNYLLLKNKENYLATKVIYFILEDKYEIRIYNNEADLENNDVEYLVTFYNTNRAYFKGYQGVNRNIFIIHRDDTLKKADFEYIYNALNRIMYMLKAVDEDSLFVSHVDCLSYDLASNQLVK